MFYLALAVGTALVSSPVSNQPDSILTLAAARAQALEANPRIRAARSAVAAAEAGARQAGATRDPSMVVAREQTGKMVWQNTALLDQPLELFGQRSSRAAAGRARLAVAEQNLAATVRRVESEVAAAFAAAQAADRGLGLADSIVQAFERAGRIVSSRVRAGDASGYEARRLQLEAARYEGLLAEVRARRQEARSSLAILLGRDPGDTAWRVLGSFRVEPLAVARDSLSQLAAATDGSAATALALARAAEADVLRLRRERIPVLSLGIGYKEERTGTPAPSSGYLAQLSLPIPLWGSRGAAVAAGAAEAERLSALAREATLSSRRDAMAAADRLDAVVRRYATLSARLGPEAASARRSAEIAFAEGEMTLVEWLDAVRAFHEASVEEADLIAQFVARSAELEQLTGLTLLTR